MKIIAILLAGFSLPVFLGYFIFLDDKATPLLTLAIILSVAPAYCWRKTRSLALPIIGLLFLHSLFFRTFINGEVSLCHDSYTATKLMSLLQQWRVEGFDLGWNPFLGAGQPLFLFSNFLHYLASELFIQYSRIFDLEISGNQLNNLVFITGHYYASVGLVLLLRLLVSNAVLTLFGMSAFLFGGLFYNNIVQHYATQIVNPIVYSLFFLIHFLKYRGVSSLFLFFLFFGAFANNYIPVYIGIMLVLFFLSWCVAQPTNALPLKQWLQAIRKQIFSIPLLSKIPQLVLCGIIFLITAGPIVFLYLEMSDFVSPTRGFNQSGDINTRDYGNQGSVNAPLSGYKILYEKKGDPGRGGTPFHHTSFIGIPAFLFVGLPFFLLLQRGKKKNAFADYREFWSRVFAIALVGVMIIGAGKDSSFWTVYVDYLPFGSTIRH